MTAHYGGGWRSRAGRGRSLSRIVAVASSTLLLASAVVATTANPALAGFTVFVRPVSMATTDSHHPTTAFPDTDGNLPVGSWLDDEENRHTSRAYFTFDLTPYKGKRIIRAMGSSGESGVTDCGKPRRIELWRSDTPESAPTWNNAPMGQEKIGDLGPASGIPCPASYLEIDLTPALQQAVAAGLEKITFVARIHEDVEKQVSHGRWLKNLGISLEHNTAPDTPGKLGVSGIACADELFIGTTTPYLQAEVTDPDVSQTGGQDSVTATFAWWPVDRPAERTEWTSYHSHAPAWFRYTVPSGQMVNGGTYAFAVRAADSHDQSAWSAECRFTIDTVRPPAPTVTSTDYPDDGESHGGSGIPGTFTFTSDADDLTGFYYGESAPSKFVPVESPGRSATITFIPTQRGINQLYVESVDRTGNRSSQTLYQFLVRDTSPTVTDGNPDGRLGQARDFTFSPNMFDVVEYVWRLNDDAERTVAADAEGRATVSVTPTTEWNTLHVRSRTRDGLLSGEASRNFYVRTEPLVSSEQWPLDGSIGAPVGTEGSFVFKPGMGGVTEYVYSFDWGEQQTVRAGEDGSATVSYTPDTAYYHSLQVFSRTGDGVESAIVDLSFEVAPLAPTVESTVYPRNATGGGPGVTGTFTVRPHPMSTGVTSYIYTFRGEPERTIQAGPDGTATIEWTPGSSNDEWAGWNELQVRARTASGMTTDAEYYSFRVDPLSPMVASDVFGWPSSATVGQTGDFAFTAQLPGTTEFVYSFDGGPERTVAADAAGTARVSWTAESAYGHDLTVRSRTATGLTSGPAYYSIWIEQS